MKGRVQGHKKLNRNLRPSLCNLAMKLMLCEVIPLILQAFFLYLFLSRIINASNSLDTVHSLKALTSLILGTGTQGHKYTVIV